MLSIHSLTDPVNDEEKVVSDNDLRRLITCHNSVLCAKVSEIRQMNRGLVRNTYLDMNSTLICLPGNMFNIKTQIQQLVLRVSL